MEEYFAITAETPIVLYGVSDFFSDIIAHILSSGYNVVAYLDIRAKQLQGTLSLPVYTIESAPFTVEQKQEICVIICLNYIAKHSYVAEQLNNNGYNKILFIPTEPNIKAEHLNAFSYSYRMLTEKKLTELGKLPLYTTMTAFKKYDSTQSIVKRNGDLVTVFIPFEIIFSGTTTNRYTNTNISMLHSYRKLFELLSFGLCSYEDLNEYLSIKLTTPIENYDSSIINDIINSRKRLYHLYCLELNRGMDYFVNSPVTASLTNDNYFVINDGHHRAYFLYSKGIYNIPCMITCADYERWVNIEALSSVKNIMNQENKEQLYCPVPHPEFMYLLDSSNGNCRNILKKVVENIDIEVLRGSFIEISDYNCYFSRFFILSGASYVVSVENTDYKYNLANSINTLLNLSQINVVQCNNMDILSLGLFNVAIVALDIFDEDELILFLKKLDAIVSDMLFIELDGSKNQGKEYISQSTNFKNSKKLATFWKNDHICDLWLCQK